MSLLAQSKGDFDHKKAEKRPQLRKCFSKPKTKYNQTFAKFNKKITFENFSSKQIFENTNKDYQKAHDK